MTKARTKRVSREDRRRQQAMERRRRRLMWVGMALLAVTVVGFVAFREATKSEPGEAVRSMGNQHIEPEQVGSIVYNSTPPTSGPHLGQLASWGVHTEPIPNELQVHNLEDGGVMLQYDCEGCDGLVDQLAEIARRYQERVILAPYAGMDNRIALTAWGRIDSFDEFDEERIVAFIDAYAGADHHASAP